MELKVSISAKKIVRVLVIVVLTLTFSGAVGQYFTYYTGHSSVFGFVPLFNVDNEVSIPTWYSTFALLFCAILLMIIAAAKKKNHDSYTLHWIILSVIFLYLSLDEGAAIHETVIVSLLRSGFEKRSFLYYMTWVIPGIVISLVFLLSYFRFLLHLPRRTKQLFIYAGILLVGGSVGMEFAAGVFLFITGSGLENMTFGVMTVIEEFMEMSGIIVFIYALLTYISSNVLKELMISFDEKRK